MKIMIVGNGSITKYDTFMEYAKKSDFIICCDGGLKYFFECGIIPDIVIGDLDSADKKYVDYFEKLNVKFEKFPPEKDFTDMELGLIYAIEKKAEEIFVFGGIGSRFDHTLTNAHILKKALDNNILAWLIDENNKITLINKYVKIFGNKGDLVSLIPFTSEVTGVTTKGLYYSLFNSKMKIENSIGVSNVMIDNFFEVFVEKGILFVILSKDT